jgi:hypothetical protein
MVAARPSKAEVFGKCGKRLRDRTAESGIFLPLTRLPERPTRIVVRRNFSAIFRLVLALTMIFPALATRAMAADKVELSVDASKTGAKIDRNLFGQFAEHLGHGIYDGIWAGFPNPEHARHSERRCGSAQGDKSAGRSLAWRLFRGRIPLA